MKRGDLVRKRWGRIDPDIMGQVAIIIDVDKESHFISVELPCGMRRWRQSETEEVINESR